MAKVFTIQELSKFNGLNKKPAYIGYKGKVYDVTKIFQNGEHAGIKAGTDLTANFSQSLHQEDMFLNFPVVGKLTGQTGLAEKIFRGSAQHGDLILRIGLGSVFFAHGAQKLLGWFGGFGWTGTLGFFTQALGIPAPLAALAILAEFFGGIAILLGLLTRPAALALALTMLVAALKVHLPNGFFLDGQGPKDGVEYIFILLMASLYFVVKGAGGLSVDRVIAERILGK